MIKHGHAYSISCRLEVAGDIILDCDVKAIEFYMMVNFKVANCSSFRDIYNKSFPDPEVSGGAGGISAICCRQEAADDVISSLYV